MKTPDTRKVCLACFNLLFPHKMPSVWTWGRECSQCRKPTPSRALLVKIDSAPTQDVGVVAVDMRHKLG